MNIFQQSIFKTRSAMHDAKKQVGLALKRMRADKQQAQTQLELLIDEICAETGLKPTPENLPTIMLYVTRFVEDQRQQTDGDSEGMQDYQF